MKRKTLKTFFRPDMAVESRGYSPSAAKPAKVVADWQDHGFDLEIVSFEPVTAKDLELAHDPRFINGVLQHKLSNGHGNRIPEVTASCLLTCGSLVAAARAAMTEPIVCSPTSGFHHAGYDYCGGFCTFNGLIVAARTVINEGLTPAVAILDWDAHYGDGTDSCIDALLLHDTVLHWTFGAEMSSRRASRRQQRYNHNAMRKSALKFLEDAKQSGARLVIYQAGADPHINDPLGGSMTSEEMQDRDAFVFGECHRLGLNVVWNLAGGYQVDKDGSIGPVLDLHRTTIKEATDVLRLCRAKEATEVLALHDLPA